MMNSSIDDGGLEFRGTEATLKINRSGFAVYREGVQDGQNPVLTETVSATAPSPTWRISSSCVKSRKEPNAPVETGVAAARAGHIGNLAYPPRRPDGMAAEGPGSAAEVLLALAQFANPDIPVAHRIAVVLQTERKLVRRGLVGRPHMVAGGAG